MFSFLLLLASILSKKSFSGDHYGGFGLLMFFELFLEAQLILGILSRCTTL